MSFGAPKPPDPMQTAQQQQQFNIQAAKDQNKNNSYDQSSPFGTVNYVPDPSSPSGYRIVTDTNQTGKTLLSSADALATNSAGMYSQPFNGENKAVTDKLNEWSGNYLKPIFGQQDSNLEAQLRNQGLMPGTAAYDNAKNLLARNQGDVTTSYLTKNQQQAFDQALKEYQLPAETIAALRANAMPGGFQSGPTANIQPANYAGLVQSQYEAQMKNYEAMWKGIGQLGGSAMNLFGGPSGMFGGSGGGVSGWDSYGGTTFPKIGGGWG
jgi:hypothetical protein